MRQPHDDDGDGLVDCADLECRAAAANADSSHFADSVAFLFEATTGSCAGAPAQEGLVIGAIDRGRVGVVRGQALERDGAPVRGAVVTVVGEAGLGSVHTDSTGQFTIAANGGAAVTVGVSFAGRRLASCLRGGVRRAHPSTPQGTSRRSRLQATGRTPLAMKRTVGRRDTRRPPTCLRTRTRPQRSHRLAHSRARSTPEVAPLPGRGIRNRGFPKS